MKNGFRVFQIAFTYIGTIVGAGFATGQEILQFFTQYGKWATLTILFSTSLFIWLGTKMMTISRQIGAASYEDLNKHLFGKKAGAFISLAMLVILLGVNSVMLAGAGSVFAEHLNLHYQTGLLITIFGSYLVLSRGMNAIMKMNSVVVPFMILLSVLIVFKTSHLPTAFRFITLTTDHPPILAWLSPLLYTSFNLLMAQAILVPLGSRIENRRTLRLGGILGGIGVGFMLLSAHFAMSAQMPNIMQYEIPMGNIAVQLGTAIHLIYIFLIFMEIFSTFVADMYGVTLQLQQRLSVSPKLISLTVMVMCYLLSQFGFSNLLSILYPIFGLLGLFWVIRLMRAK